MATCDDSLVPPQKKRMTEKLPTTVPISSFTPTRVASTSTINEDLLLNQKRRMGGAKLRERYAAAERELDDETDWMTRERDEALVSRPTGKVSPVPGDVGKVDDVITTAATSSSTVGKPSCPSSIVANRDTTRRERAEAVNLGDLGSQGRSIMPELAGDTTASALSLPPSIIQSATGTLQADTAGAPTTFNREQNNDTGERTVSDYRSPALFSMASVCGHGAGVASPIKRSTAPSPSKLLAVSSGSAATTASTRADTVRGVHYPRSQTSSSLTPGELIGTSLGAPLKRSRSVSKGCGKSLSQPRYDVDDNGVQWKRVRGNRERGKVRRGNKKQGLAIPTSSAPAASPTKHALQLNTKHAPQLNTGSNTEVRAIEPTARDVTAVTARRAAEGANDGPFAELHVCAVRLGSVTKNTVCAWTREVARGGGRVSTSYSPGETTHIVADVSLSWTTLDRYDGWLGNASGEVAGGLVPHADVIAGEDGGTGGAPDDVPLVGSTWMVECLKSSTVVSVAAHTLYRPTLPLYPVSVGALLRRNRHGSYMGTAADVVAAADLAATQGSRVNLGRAGSNGEKVQSYTMPEGCCTPHEDVLQGGSKVGMREEEVKEQEDDARPLAESCLVEGGIGGGNLSITDKRSKFFCQTGSFRDHKPCNEQAAKALESLSEMYAVLGGSDNGWREKGFKRAAAVLRGLGTEITCIKQLKEMKKGEPERLRGFGNSAMVLLEEFFSDGKMEQLEGLALEDRIQSLTVFNNIWGVGARSAEELVSAGFRTIEDVRCRGRDMLQRQQLVGLDRYEDLMERMPRAEAAEIEAVVTAAATTLCPGVQCQACGSYRRGKDSCGDVDVLIQPPKGQEDCSIMLALLESLRSSGFLTDDLSLPKPHEPGVPQSYMGVCKLPGEGHRHRRLDVKLYPTSMFGFALLYFTGSAHFNCSMRCFAKVKGLSLSDRGLRPVNRVFGKKVHSFPSYRCPTEQDVFTALGLEFREPTDRSGYDVHPVVGKAERYRTTGPGTIASIATGTLPFAGLPDDKMENLEEWPAVDAARFQAVANGGCSIEGGVFGGDDGQREAGDD